MAVCMVVSLLPVTAMAQELEEVPLAEQEEEADATLAFVQSNALLSEGSSQTVLLTRTEEVEQEKTYTVLVYDNSTNYGEDYQIRYDGAVVEKEPGATSVYDAFRDQGELTSGLSFDLTTMAQQVEAAKTGEETETAVSVADMLAQLDELQAKAAAFPVTFDAGEISVSLEIEVLEDDESEYEETFLLAALEENGAAAQQIFAIADNDTPAPSVAVSFSGETELELHRDSGEAELTFTRTGNLATTTLAALCRNGEPMGWVDFTPWQETQTVWVVQEGTYTLLDADGITIPDQQAVVYDNRPAAQSLPEDADAELDSLPEEYAVIQSQKKSFDTSWLPSWAKGGSYSNEDEIVVMGSTSNNLFKQGGKTSKGGVEFFVDGQNVHDVCTSGTGSRLSTGYLFADAKEKRDMTGVESVTSVVKTEGVDKNADICIGVNGGYRYTQRITEGGVYTLTETLPSKLHATGYVYYGNTDPDKSSGGISMYVPNGYKLNLRHYRFIIEDDPNYVNSLEYTYDNETIKKVPTINSSKKYQTMTINSNKTVDIVYSCDPETPARLVGYKIRNYKTGEIAGVYALNDDGNGTGGTASITFDANFLKKYEDKYCEEVNIDGNTLWTFHIIPIYEKIGLESYYILPSDTVKDSNLKMVEGTGKYIGDIAVFEDKTSSTPLSGVWYQGKSSLSDSSAEQYISQTPYKAGSDRQFLVNLRHPHYVFQGVYNKEAVRLVVEYADSSAPNRGKLDNAVGEVVSEEQYVVDDYVALVAKPNDGYVTKWHAKGTDYYGNVFYYQLNGNPDHNTVTVDFVKETTATSTLSGSLYRADVNLRTGVTSRNIPMANTKIDITADKTYSATTDENGVFSIPDFVGVEGGVYSVAVTYENAIGYTTFTYHSGQAISINLPQFAAGVPYPKSVSANVNGGGANQNMLTLNENGTLQATVQVYVPPKNYKITDVNLYFLKPELVESGATTQAKAYPATCEKTSGNTEVWTCSVPASALESGAQMYVEVKADKTIYLNGETGTTATTTNMSSGLVNGGYQLTTPNIDPSISVNYDVPEVPGLQNASGIDLSKLNIPVLGNLDFSISSKTGGFFVQRTDENGNPVLICGSSYLSSFGTGSVSEKLDKKRAAQQTIKEKEESKAFADQPSGGAEPNVDASIPGDTMEGTGSMTNGKNKTPTNWSFSPAFLFKFTLDKDTSAVKQYEMALGVDAFYARNIPFSVYGVPFYVCLSFKTEAYGDLQVAFQDDTYNVDGVVDDWNTMLMDDTKVTMDSFIAAPAMSFSATGGVGYNGFLSLYLQALVNAPFIISLQPVDAAAQLSFSVGAGANLVVFDTVISETLNLDPFGNEALIADLKTITAKAEETTELQSLQNSKFFAENRALDIEKLLNEATFSVMERTGGVRRTSAAGYAAQNVFKNTGVHLLRLDDNNVLAFFLQDTANTGSETLNYLTASYVQSTDGGKTWGNMQYVSDNRGNPNTSLQFDINLFQLEDRTLVTWSEANFDEVLKNLGDVDINKLTPAQISKFMNAMNLKGRFFDSTTGKPMGDAFTIAEKSTIACSVIDAVQNGDMVYVYYQRNNFPTAKNGGDVTLSDLLATERTIAMARANVNNASEWTSTRVRATNEKGQEYRITDVEPFVHDGVMGEVLVLDRDGKLAEWDKTTKSWNPSNEDRQLYLRTYDFAADGTPEPTALMAFTDANACAQNPEVVSNEDYLHLFWNQNGQIVYVSDFVATSKDNPDVQEAAYILKKDDGTVTTQHKGEFTVNSIASDDSLHVGTKFSAAIDEGKNVLLSWIAANTTKEQLLPTDEVYGVILETLTNQEAVKRSEEWKDGDEEGNGNLYQLYANGTPVALTDQDELIGALDSLFMNEDGFLLAFTEMNSKLQSEITAANIRTIRSEYQPELKIEEVSAPNYPTPGSTMTVEVTVTNNGLGTAENVVVTAETLSGIGSGVSKTISKLQSGCSETVVLEIDVPETFNASATLTVTAKANGSTAQADKNILYGAYFELKEMPEMTSITGTQDYLTKTKVYNTGNAAGTPTLTFANDLFAVNDKAKMYTYETEDDTEKSIAPDGMAVFTYILEDTLVKDTNDIGTLTVSVGDGVNQSVQGQMPKLEKYVSLSGVTEAESNKPSSSHHSGGSNKAPGEVPETPVTPETPETPTEPTAVVFKDVAADAYYANAVQWAVEQGITSGTSATTFSPDASCTRAEAVTFLWRNAGCPKAESTTMPFVDVPANAYYYDAVLWAVEQGITAGTTATTFSPDATCTRAQIVSFIYRNEQANGGGFKGAWMFRLPYTDTPEWAYEAIAWCYKENITSGTSETTFSPDDFCTRAQIVTFLYRSGN